eukprot:5079004-Pleurochrysis_carterae.AAC.1
MASPAPAQQFDTRPPSPRAQDDGRRKSERGPAGDGRFKTARREGHAPRRGFMGSQTSHLPPD